LWLIFQQLKHKNGLRGQDQGLSFCGLFHRFILRHFPPFRLLYFANAQKLCLKCGIEYGQGIEHVPGENLQQKLIFVLIDE
jgi:hypothetical protein